MEVEIEDGLLGKIPNKNFGDLLDRYSTEVSPLKQGHIREVKTIALIMKDELAQVALEALSSE